MFETHKFSGIFLEVFITTQRYNEQVKVLTKALGMSRVSGSRTYTMSIIASMSTAMLRTVAYPIIFPVLSLH